MHSYPGGHRIGWERDEEELRDQDSDPKPIPSSPDFWEVVAIIFAIIFVLAVVGGIIWLIIIGLDHVLKAIGFVR